MRLTVVTVCRNAGARIERTAAGVAAQTLSGAEWLVIDGASTDDTVARVEAWRERLRVPLRIVSEPDSGIYDAMNKGLRLAAGERVLFLNAGDAPADADAWAALLAAATDADDLTTARVALLDLADGYRKTVGEPFGWPGVAAGRVPPHPGCLYRRSAALAAGGYEPGVAGIAADTLLTLRVAAGTKPVFLDRVVAEFALDGVSSRFDWRWRVHRDKARAVRAAAPEWVWRRYRRRWPVEALRATASHLLARAGLLGAWRRFKGGF